MESSSGVIKEISHSCSERTERSSMADLVLLSDFVCDET